MHARNVTMRLKPNTAEEFTRTLDQNILPLLRQQSGFADELTFLLPDGTEAMAISLWDSKASADAYNRTGYPEVLRGLSNVVEGTPVVRDYEVSNSTFHKVPARN